MENWTIEKINNYEGPVYANEFRDNRGIANLSGFEQTVEVKCSYDIEVYNENGMIYQHLFDNIEDMQKFMESISLTKNKFFGWYRKKKDN